MSGQGKARPSATRDSDAELARKLDAARAAVAQAVGGMAGQHEAATLLHAVAYVLGGMVELHAVMCRVPLNVVINQVGGTIGHGATCAMARRRLAALSPAGRA